MNERAEAVPAKRTWADPPGVKDVWVLIMIDACAFLVYFLVFAVARAQNAELYEQARQQLNPILGFVNTLILLTSSWFVVRAVSAAKQASPAGVRHNLLAAVLLGVSFMVLKVIGYAGDAAEGHGVMADGVFGFFGYYYVLTGVHFLHVVVGVGVLITLILKARPREMDPKLLPWIESGASFWHLVDLLWVMLFPMFYLLKGIS